MPSPGSRVWPVGTVKPCVVARVGHELRGTVVRCTAEDDPALTVRYHAPTYLVGLMAGDRGTITCVKVGPGGSDWRFDATRGEKGRDGDKRGSAQNC